MLELCLNVLSSEGGLKQNICNISKSHTHKSTISPSPLETIPPAVQYSSIYWLVHLDSILQSGNVKEWEKQVLTFFDTQILHWMYSIVWKIGRCSALAAKNRIVSKGKFMQNL
jgi:hypothetical protein